MPDARDDIPGGQVGIGRGVEEVDAAGGRARAWCIGGHLAVKVTVCPKFAELADGTDGGRRAVLLNGLGQGSRVLNAKLPLPP